jgi:hypothetical protein
MKRYLLIVGLVSAVLVGCSGGEDAVATSVALTVEAAPTSTPLPTETPAPTETPEPTDTPTVEPLSPAFVSQVTNFLEEGSSLTGATSTGVTFVEFGRLLGRAKGAYDLALDTWPSNVSRDSIEDFDQAFLGWSLVDDLWDLKFGDFDNPVEPDINAAWIAGLNWLMRRSNRFNSAAEHRSSSAAQTCTSRRFSAE